MFCSEMSYTGVGENKPGLKKLVLKSIILTLKSQEILYHTAKWKQMFKFQHCCEHNAVWTLTRPYLIAINEHLQMPTLRFTDLTRFYYVIKYKCNLFKYISIRNMDLITNLMPVTFDPPCSHPCSEMSQ